MNKMIPALALGTIIASVACMHLVKELRAERTRSALLVRQIEDLKNTRERTEVSAAADPTPGSNAMNGAAGAQNRAPRARSVVSEAQPRQLSEARKSILQTREQLRDPQYRDLVREEFKHGFDVRYPGVQKELDLSDEQVQDLIELLADQHLRMIEENGEAALVDPRDTAAIEQLRARQDERLEQRRAEVQELFGANKYEEWLDYHRTIPLRHRATRLQAELASVGLPTSPAQSTALLATLLQEQQRLGGSDPERAIADGFARIESEDTLAARLEHDRQFLSTLQSSLTSEQISALDRILERERDAERLSLEAQRREAMPKTSDGSSPPGAWMPIEDPESD